MTQPCQSRQVLNYLRLLDRVYRGNQKHGCPHPYTSQADFILQHGRSFELKPLPKGIRYRTPRLCFHNCAKLVLWRPNTFTYCEGYAMGPCPIYHAWVMDKDGFALDPTWTDWMRSGNAEYFGVPFRVEYLRRLAGSKHGFGAVLDNHEDDWPLCTGAHSIAEALQQQSQPIREQARIREEMAEHGYPTPVEGPRRTFQQLCGLGASDWLAEEDIEMGLAKAVGGGS